MRTYLLALGIGLFAVHLHAAPTMGLVRATPMTAVIGVATHITVTASISDPSLIPTSVNLLQLDANGNTLGILATLHDDGANGDATAGDKVFTTVITLDVASQSQVQLQVSAAFRGQLLRVRSGVMNVFFQPADAPQQAIGALVQNLSAGNVATALNAVVPSDKTTRSLSTLPPAGLAALASILQNGVLVDSRDDLLVFRSTFATPSGVTTAEFTMVPGPNGQWLINSW